MRRGWGGGCCYRSEQNAHAPTQSNPDYKSVIEGNGIFPLSLTRRGVVRVEGMVVQDGPHRGGQVEARA